MSRAITFSGTTVTAGGSGASRVLTTRAPSPYDLELLLVFLRSATVECTAVAHGAGTFTRLFRQVGTTLSLELWAGYGFAEGETDTTTDLTFSASVGFGLLAEFAQNGAVQGLPTLAVPAVGATGSSGPMTPGALTPTASDESQLSLVGTGHASITAPTWTATPGGNEGHLASGFSSGIPTNGYLGRGRRTVSSLSPHNLSGTTTVEWVALHALIVPTPVAVSADTLHVYKGRDKQSLDTTGAA